MSNLSPARKSLKSPNKARPSTAASPKKSFAQQSILVKAGEFSNLANITIIEELNGQEIVSQDKDIEIERLQTTCFTLNNKLSVTEAVQQENAILRKRLQENEQIRQNMKAEMDQYERNRLEYERSRLQQENVIAEYEKTRLQQEAVIADYERIRVGELRAKNALIEENKSIRFDLQVCIAMKTKLQAELE